MRRTTQDKAEQYAANRRSGDFVDSEEDGNLFALSENENALVVRQNGGNLSLLDFDANAAGVLIPEDTPDEKIYQLRDTLFTLWDGLQIYIGDLLVALNNREYGETKAIAEQYHRNPETLYKWKRICASVSIHLRRGVLAANPDAIKLLSISHYEMVENLPPDKQEQFLMAALADGWSVAKLRNEVKAQLTGTVDGSGDMVALDTPPALSDEMVEQDAISYDEEIEDVTDVIHEKRIAGFRKKASQNRLAEIELTEIIQSQNYLAHLRKLVARAKVEAGKQAQIKVKP